MMAVKSVIVCSRYGAMKGEVYDLGWCINWTRIPDFERATVRSLLNAAFSSVIVLHTPPGAKSSGHTTDQMLQPYTSR